MYRLYIILLLALAAMTCPTILRASPPIGASLDAVLAEKGEPAGRTGMGSTLILTYPDETIVLKQGKVAEVRPATEVTSVPDRKVTEAEKRRVAAEQSAAATTAATRADSTSTASWLTDYDTALASAQVQRRKVLLFFTGSDWCGWCTKLKREVLSRPEFSAYAEANLVLVELDFPRSKPMPAEQRARHDELARKYGVRGFPTVVILDPRGRPVGRLGYQQGGPGPFIEAIKRF